MQERRVWICILFIGILFQIISAFVMPLGLDAHIHVNYVTDEIADGDASLDWGEVRTNGQDFSTPLEVDAEDRWQVWHSIISIWFTIFGISLTSIHILSLIISFACLATIYLLTTRLFGQDNGLALVAICSIYSPLIRSSGRFYQENIILLLASLAIYGLIKIWRQQRSTFWSAISFFSLMGILSIKGLNPAYAIIIFSTAAICMINKIKLKPLPLPIFFAGCTLSAIIFTWLRVENITSDTFYFLIRALFVGGFIYVILGTLFFISNMDSKSDESNLLLLLSQLSFIGLIGYIVMLLEVEKASLEVDASIVADQFSYIFRYLTVLIVPLWWSYLARDEKNVISIKDNPRRFAMGYAILLIILLNITMLQVTKGMEYIGGEIADEVDDGDNILYVSEPYHAMHRLYTLQVEIDPDHDRNITGYWAHHEYNWSHILDDSSIDWVIFTDQWTTYLDDNWEVFESETDYLIYYRK